MRQITIDLETVEEARLALTDRYTSLKGMYKVRIPKYVKDAIAKTGKALGKISKAINLCAK